MEKKKAGRPSLSDYWRTEEGLKILASWKAKDVDDQDIARKVIGITPQTLSEWKNRFPEIKEALKFQICYKELAEIEEAGRKAAKGYFVEEEETEIWDRDGKQEKHIKKKKRWIPPNPALNIFYIKNRDKSNWRDNPDDADNATSENVKIIEAADGVVYIERDNDETSSDS